MTEADVLAAARRWAEAWRAAWRTARRGAAAAVRRGRGVPVAPVPRAAGARGLRRLGLPGRGRGEGVVRRAARRGNGPGRGRVLGREHPSARHHETIAGVALLRFGPDGRVVEQRDYWNAAEGAVEQVAEAGIGRLNRSSAGTVSSIGASRTRSVRARPTGAWSRLRVRPRAGPSRGDRRVRSPGRRQRPGRRDPSRRRRPDHAGGVRPGGVPGGRPGVLPARLGPRGRAPAARRRRGPRLSLSERFDCAGLDDEIFPAVRGPQRCCGATPSGTTRATSSTCRTTGTGATSGSSSRRSTTSSPTSSAGRSPRSSAYRRAGAATGLAPSHLPRRPRRSGQHDPGRPVPRDVRARAAERRVGGRRQQPRPVHRLAARTRRPVVADRVRRRSDLGVLTADRQDQNASTAACRRRAPSTPPSAPPRRGARSRPSRRRACGRRARRSPA